MTKEEKIKEAWNNADGLNTENWANFWTYEEAKEHGMDENGWIRVCGYEYRKGTVCDYMRPPQLKGIEDNNGWISLLNNKEEFYDYGEVELFNMNTREYYICTDRHEPVELNEFTHFKPFKRSKYPLWQ